MSLYRHRINGLAVDAVEVPAPDGDWTEATAWLSGRDAALVGLGGDLIVLTVSGGPVSPVRAGEWIVEGLGEISPCSAEGFAATYEPA
jgi:hypothetical protein